MSLSSNSSSSGLDVWFKDDVKNMLGAIEAANADLFRTIDTPEMQLYWQGYEAALRAVAEGFGLSHKSSIRNYQEVPTIIDVTPEK